LDEVAQVEGPLLEIAKEKVKAALKRMEKGRGQDQQELPVICYKPIGMVGIRDLSNRNIMNERFSGEK